MTVPVKRLCQSLLTERTEDLLLDFVCFSFLFSSACIYMVKGVCLQEWHPQGGRGSEAQLQHSNLHRAFWDHACEPSRWPTACPQRGSNHFIISCSFGSFFSTAGLRALRCGVTGRAAWSVFGGSGLHWADAHSFWTIKLHLNTDGIFPSHADTQTTHLRHSFTFLKVQKKISKLTA